MYTHIHLKHIVMVLASVVNLTCTRVTEEEGAQATHTQTHTHIYVRIYIDEYTYI